LITGDGRSKKGKAREKYTRMKGEGEHKKAWRWVPRVGSGREKRQKRERKGQ